MHAKTLHNTPAAAVDEALEGLLLTRPDLCLVGPPSMRVIARSSIDPSKVGLLCGGGAGHEPSHAGFVGEGMLTASVTGDIFSSPTAKLPALVDQTAGAPDGKLLPPPSSPNSAPSAAK